MYSPVEAFRGSAESGQLLAVRACTPNPTAVLTSEKFRKMIEDLRNDYDRIIIDLPPFLGASRRAHCSRASDGVVMVIARFGQASKYGLKIAESIRELRGNDDDRYCPPTTWQDDSCMHLSLLLL